MNRPTILPIGRRNYRAFLYAINPLLAVFHDAERAAEAHLWEIGRR